LIIPIDYIDRNGKQQTNRTNNNNITRKYYYEFIAGSLSKGCLESSMWFDSSKSDHMNK